MIGFGSHFEDAFFALCPLISLPLVVSLPIDIVPIVIHPVFSPIRVNLMGPDPLGALHPIAHYCRGLPGSRGAARMHPATMTRWILMGISTPMGRIRLPAIRAGSRWLVRDDDFRQFMQDLTTSALPAPIQDSRLTRPTPENRAAEAAARALKDRHGV